MTISRHACLAYILWLRLAEPASQPASQPSSGLSVTLYERYNQALNVLNPGGASKGGTVVYKGEFDTLAECQHACVNHQADRCWSFVYFVPQQSKRARAAAL